ncbi:MAG: fused MFS/spermidine synthase [Pseudomonadota bacterium]
MNSMIHPKTTFWLFFVIVLEGYVVLSSELIAIRQSIPYTGSGTETVSIIIAAVLMPLAFGYYAGGRFRPKPSFTVRDKLIQNIMIAMVILLPGLSYIVIGEMHEFANSIGLKHRLAQISVYSLIFIVIPVYLLGQTIPLVSNYFGKERLAKVTGRILFFSTLGSFAGAVFSTLVLMGTIGVNNTAALNFIILAVLLIVLSRKKLAWRPILGVLIACFAVYLNSNYLEYKVNGIIEHNKYNTIALKEIRRSTHLMLNNSPSSKFDVNGQKGYRKYTYVNRLEEWILSPLWSIPKRHDILVIGAGGFTFGYDTYDNEDFHYDFVDIDGNLKDIAEAHILPEPLGDNKKFHAMPARAFLSQTDKKYDVIFLDAYFGKFTLPEHLVTVEFFDQIKSHLKDKAVLAANFITSPNFFDPFSRRLDNTFRSVFPHVSRIAIMDRFFLWNENKNVTSNILYLYSHHGDYGVEGVYTDNLNTVYRDRP